MGVTAGLCDKIVATTFDSLTPEAVTKARRLVLDGIAVAVAGSRETAISILADHYRSLGGTPDAAVLGLGFRTSATAAAVLNGASMHVLDFEPMWKPGQSRAVHHAARDSFAGGVTQVSRPRRRHRPGQGHRTGRLDSRTPGMTAPPGSTRPAWSARWVRRWQRPTYWAWTPRSLPMRSASPHRAPVALTANAGTMTKSTHCGQGVMLGLEAAMLAGARLHRQPRNVRGAPRLCRTPSSRRNSSRAI